jgi:hypothetical protein
MTPTFTPKERDLIRMTFMVRFGQAVPLREGIWLRTWSSGPSKGQPKLTKTVQGMLDRGLVRVGQGRLGPAALFTEDGMAALRAMAADRRQLDPEAFGHLIAELEEMSRP